MSGRESVALCLSEPTLCLVTQVLENADSPFANRSCPCLLSLLGILAQRRCMGLITITARTSVAFAVCQPMSSHFTYKLLILTSHVRRGILGDASVTDRETEAPDGWDSSEL